MSRLDEKSGHPDRFTARRRLIAQMCHAFPGSQIEAPKDREYGYGLSDPDDEHVEHAALFGRADAIVTSDRRSGMEDAELLRDASIEVVEPHVFAANTVVAHREAGIRAILTLAKRRKQPSMSPLDTLERLRASFAMDEVYEHLHRSVTDDLLW